MCFGLKNHLARFGVSVSMGERACLMSPVWLTKIRGNKQKPPGFGWYRITFTLYQKWQLGNAINVHFQLHVFFCPHYQLPQISQYHGVGVDHRLAEHWCDFAGLERQVPVDRGHGGKGLGDFESGTDHRPTGHVDQ